MLFGMIGSCYDDFCRRAAMDGIVHLILNCSKGILCGLAIEGVVHSGGVNIRDFLVKAPFAGSPTLEQSCSHLL